MLPISVSIRNLAAASRQFRAIAILPHLLVAALVVTLPSAAQTPGKTIPPAQAAENRVEAKAQMLTQSLGFEPNRGQAEAGVDFVSRGRGYSLLLSGSESTFVTAGDHSSPAGRSIHMQLVGADAAVKPRAEKPLPGQSSYLMGNDPSRWVHGVQQFQQVRLANAYPGIDLLYYGNQKQVEHDFIVSPGADPNQIRMQFSGAASQTIGEGGDLQLKTHEGSTVSLEKPVAYQTLASGERLTVGADYASLSDNAVGFRLGVYDHSRPLIIDPVVITYSTYLGGNDQDSVVDLKLDAAGNIYVLMSTDSTDLPVVSQIAGGCASTCGPRNPTTQATSQTSPIRDFYLAKLDPTGQTMLFATYIGGSGDDVPGALSLSRDGGIYIAGETVSSDFPLVNQYSSTLASAYTGGYPFFTGTMTRLSTDGSSIVYSSLIGGGLVNFSGENGGRYYGTSTNSIAAGPNGIVYLIGYADTANGGGGFGDFVDAKNTSNMVGLGAFLAKFDTSMTGYASLVYATTFGQPTDRHSEFLWAVALDSKQDVWLVGDQGDSPPKPTPNAVQPICAGGRQCENAYIYELNPAGSIVYASFLGGTMSPNDGIPQEVPLSIAIDSSDNIYITGGTNAIDFPTTKNAATPTNTSGSGGFLTKLSPGGLSMLYSTYTPESFILAVTPGGIAGGVTSFLGTGFPVKNGFTSVLGSTTDAVFQLYDTALSGDASLLASSYLGANSFTVGQTAAFDATGNFLFGGYTEAAALPLVNPIQSTCSGGCYNAGNYFPDGFITRVQPGASVGTVTLLPATQSSPNTAFGSTSAVMTSVLKNTTSSAFAFTSGLTNSTDFKETDDCNGTVAAGASCTFSFIFAPQSAAALSSTFTITGTATPATTLSVALSGTGTAPAVPTLTPASIDFGNQADLTTSNAKFITLTNTTSSSIPAYSALSFSPHFGYSVTTPGTCGNTLAAGASCTIALVFVPNSLGPVTGTVTVGTGALAVTAALSGTGTAAPVPTLTPATLAFGSVTVGATSTVQMLTLKNTTASTIAALSGITTPAQFGYAAGGSCGNTLAAGASCTIAVIFQPTTAGPATGIFTVGTGATAATASVTGTGAAVVTVTISPSSLDFGTVSVNTTSPAQFLTLSNPTTAAVPLSSVVIPPQFANEGHGSCGASLAPGTSCTLEVVYQPTSAGPASGTFTFGPVTAALTGTGTATPLAAFMPANLDFGAVAVGANSKEITTVLTNPGPDPIAFNIESGGDGTFVKDSDICDSGLPIFGATIAPGGSCTLQYHFQPTSVGSFSGSFFVRIGGIDTGFKASLTFTGIGVDGTSDIVAPGILDFGTVSLNTTSAGQFITLRNPTTDTIGLSSITVPPPFANEGHGTCGANLAPGATCTLEFVFKPTSVGSTVGTFTLGTATAILKGTGTTVPLPAFTPANVDFGSVDVGTYSSIVILTLSNPGANAVTFARLSANGSFAIAGTTCGPGIPIAPGSSCTFTVAFLPNATGMVSENLGVAFTDGSETSITLTGIGVTGKPIIISPGSLNFGNVLAGSTSSMDLTFTNPNPGEFAITSFSFTGPYSAVGGSCGGSSIPANGSCTFTVGFRPTSIGSFPGSVVFHLSDGSSTNVTFTGTGVGAVPPTVTPGLLNFGNVTIGTTSATQFITFMNPGTIAITLTAPSFAIGANGGTFQINGGTCVGLSSVAGGASCTYGVTYIATIPGQGGGLMFLGGSTVQTATQVTLSATSVPSTPPDFTLNTPLGTAVTVQHGSFANLILQVASASATNPFTSPVTFTVSGLPAGVTASFSSSVVTPIPGGSTVIMRVAAANTNAQNKPFPPRGRETAFGVSAAALMAGLVGFRRRLNARLLLLLCALGLLGGIVGCGTGVSSTTTASTSNIVVTASSGSISHTVNIAVTVQ